MVVKISEHGTRIHSPPVHLDESGEIDCYFTEAGATVVPGASRH